MLPHLNIPSKNVNVFFSPKMGIVLIFSFWTKYVLQRNWTPGSSPPNPNPTQPPPTTDRLLPESVPRGYPTHYRYLKKQKTGTQREHVQLKYQIINWAHFLILTSLPVSSIIQQVLKRFKSITIIWPKLNIFRISWAS